MQEKESTLFWKHDSKKLIEASDDTVGPTNDRVAMGEAGEAHECVDCGTHREISASISDSNGWTTSRHRLDDIPLSTRGREG